MKNRMLVSRAVVIEKDVSRPTADKTLSVSQATVIVAAISLLSAGGTAWVAGAFNRSTVVESAYVKTAGETAVAEVRSEAEFQVEEIRKLSALGVEQMRLDGNIEIERFKLQRDLVLKAIDTGDSEEAKRRLIFFSRTGLIPDFSEGVISFLEDQNSELPSLVERGLPSFPAMVIPMDQTILSKLEVEYLKRVGVLTLSEDPTQFFCNATRIRNGVIAVPAHCAQVRGRPLFSEAPGPFGMPQSGVFGNEAINRENNPYTVRFLPTKYLGSTSADKDPFAVSLYEVAEQGMVAVGDLEIRAPVPGEKVSLVGWAPRGLKFDYQAETVMRGLVLTGPPRAALHRDCQVLTVTETRVTTDCISAEGMSGGAIFAVSDGALVTLVAFGDEKIGPTSGPVVATVPALLDRLGQ